MIANIVWGMPQYGVSFIIVAASISYGAAMQSTFEGKIFAQLGRLGHKGRHTLIFLSSIEVPINLRLFSLEKKPWNHLTLSEYPPKRQLSTFYYFSVYTWTFESMLPNHHSMLTSFIKQCNLLQNPSKQPKLKELPPGKINRYPENAFQ